MTEIEHALRGTCEQPCPLWGKCHCGCGMDSTISARTNRSKGIYAGQPFVYLFRHREGQRRKKSYNPVTGFGEKVSTEPLRDYLMRHWSPDYEGEGLPFVEMQRRIAERAGVSQRQVARWHKTVMEKDEIALEIADVMCCGLEVPFGFVYR